MAIGSPAEIPILTFVDNVTGLPLAGGQLYTWVSGASTTPQATYSNAALTNANPNPIILDNYGEAIVYLGSGLNYRFDLINAAGVEQAHFPIDNITAATLSSNLASPTLGSDGAGQVGYTAGSHPASTVGSALDTAQTLETNLPLATLATNGAGLVGWANSNAYTAGTVGSELNALNTFTVNLGLATLAANGAALVGYSSSNSYAAGTVGYALNNFSIGTNLNKMNFNLYANASPALGDMWVDSTQQTLCVEEGASTANLAKIFKAGVISSQKTLYTVTCTTAGVYTYDLMPSVNFTNTLTIPANFMVVGKTIKIEIFFVATPASTANLGIAPMLGGLAVGNTLTATGLTAAANYGKLEVMIGCTGIGSSGKVNIGNTIIWSTLGSNGSIAASGGNNTTINTTIANAIDIQCGFSAGASGSITVEAAAISILG